MKKLFSLLALVAFCQAVNAQYCNTSWTTGCTDNDVIDDFSTTGGLTNITNLNTGCTSSGYTYYSDMTVAVLVGGSFNLSVQTATSGNIWPQGFRIYIDWNDDGDFYDTGEDVWNSGSSGTGVFTGSITAPTGSEGFHRMRVKGNYNAVPTDPCGSQTFGEEEDYNIHVVAAFKDYPYCQDFETSDGFWTVSGVLPSWEHGAPNNTNISAAYSGSNAWVTDLDGDYNNDELSNLTTLEFDLTPLNDPTLRFWQIRDLENGDDGVQVRVSTDSGATYSVLGSSSSTNWYNSASIDALNSIGNGNGWTGSTSAWTDAQHSLSSYSSDTSVFIRFIMAADGNVTNEGFGIDHVLLAESNDIAITELFYPDSACGTSATTIQASICNMSVQDLFGFGVDLDTNGTTVSYSYSDTLPVCGCDTVDLLTFNTAAGGTWTLEAEVDNSGDVNAANDTISGFMTNFATPGVSISGGGNFCEGDITALTFTFAGNSPWNLSYTDGTTGYYNANITSNPYTLNVTASGLYAPIYVTDSSGCPADTTGITGEAMVTFFPAPVVDLGPDTSVCGDVVLDAGAGFTYDWSNSATTQTITATQTGTYGVTITDSIGCTGTDEVDLEIFLLPEVNMNDTVLCEGGNFIFNAGAPYAAYLWHDGSTGQLFPIDSVGTVSVTVTDFNGCEGTATASITAVVLNPTPTITSSASLSPVTMDAGSGYASYFWNTNATTQTISVSIAGTYSCTVTDFNGCTGSASGTTKIWPASIEDVVNNQGFAIYPNPVGQVFTVEFANSIEIPQHLDVFDLRGAKVMRYVTHPQSRRQTITVGDELSPGHYTLRFVTGDAAYETPLIIVN